MSLETVDDARRIRGLSHAEYDRLLDYLEQLPPEGLTEQSACSDWKVYQVISHLGSGPEINRARLESALRGAPPQTDEQRRAIWDRWDSRKPDEMLPAFRQANEDYFKLLDSLGDDELGRVIPWFVGPVPVATALAFRLNEQALHAWDIRWARDRQAGLTPQAVPDLLQVNLQPAWLGNLAKPERAGQLAGKSIQFAYSHPEGAVNLRLDADGVKVSPDLAAGSDLTVELPAEALVRLIWGRYDVPAGLRSGDLKLSRPELAEPLQALFPGR